MNSRTRWIVAVLGTVFAFQMGCASVVRPESGHVYHLVLCWLKSPGDHEAKAELIKASQSFVQIPGVLSVTTGNPEPSERPIVDSSFDLAILIVLEDTAALKQYLEHPVHITAQENTLRVLVERVQVYDFVAEGAQVTRIERDS